MRNSGPSGFGIITLFIGGAVALLLCTIVWLSVILPMYSPQDPPSDEIQATMDDPSAQKTGTVIPGFYDTVYLSSGSSETLTIKAPHAGSYTLTIYSYSSMGAEPSSVKVSINGSPAITQSFDVTQPNCSQLCIRTTPIVVNLNVGDNTITISNEGTTDPAGCTDTNPTNIHDGKNDIEHCNFIFGVKFVPDSSNVNLHADGLILMLFAIIGVILFVVIRRRRKSAQ